MNITEIARLVIKRIKELSPLTTSLTGEEYLAIYDPLTDKTLKIKSSLLKGSSSTVEKWTSSNVYNQNNIAEWNLKLWLSLEDDNEGNIPSESEWWTEVSKSEGNAINYYEAEKAYVVDPSVVLYNSRLYVFDTSVGTLPFYSTDIEAEILLGLWERIDLDYDWTLVFIDNAATGLNDGTSWVNAYSSLKAGIEAAPDHSVIMVAARSYIVDEVITVKKNNVRIFGIPGLSNSQTPILTGDIEGDQSDLATNGTLIFEGLYCHLENFILEYFDTKTAGTGYSINVRGDNFTYKNLKFKNIASYYGAMRLGSRNSLGDNLSFLNCVGTSCAGIIFARNTVAEVNNILFDNLYNTRASETGSCLMDFGAMVKCKDIRIQNMSQHVANSTSAIYSVLSTSGGNVNANLFIENLTVDNWNTLGRILRCWTSVAHVHNLLINNTIIDLSATAAFIATNSSKILITNGTINITSGRVLGNGGDINSNLTTVNTIIQTPDDIHSLSDITTEGQITHINSYLSAHTDITAISYTDCEYGTEPLFVSSNDLKLRDTSININKGQIAYLTENTQLSGIIKDIEGIDFKLGYVHRGCYQEQIYYIDKSDVIVASAGFLNNLYLSNEDSDISGYKELSYTIDVALTTVQDTVVSSDGDKLVASYLYPDGVDIDEYPAGVWTFTIFARILAVNGETKIGFRYFKYSISDVKTYIFDNIIWSNPIINTDFALLQPLVTTQLSTEVSPTDRMGCDIFIKTSAVSTRTIEYQIGNGFASSIVTPNALPHSILRRKNFEDDFQHITLDEKTSLLAHIDGANEAKHGSDQIINATALSNLEVPAATPVSTILSAIDEKTFPKTGTFSEELLFSVQFIVRKKTQTDDIAYSLASTGNKNISYIEDIITGDGTHNVTFPVNWYNDNDGEFDTSKVNSIFFYYDVDGRVRYTITNLERVSLIELDAPLNLAAISGGIDSIIITWEVSANATSYDLEVSDDDTNWALLINQEGVTYTHTGLEEDETKYYRVKAIGDQIDYSDSDYTASVNATTSAYVDYSLVITTKENGINITNDNMWPRAASSDIPFSFEMWVKLSSSGSAQIMYIMKSTMNADVINLIRLTTNALRVVFLGQSASAISFSTNASTIQLDVWNQIVVTYDGNSTTPTVKIYVNATSLTISGGGSHGGFNDLGANHFEVQTPLTLNLTSFMIGKINLFRWFANKELSQAEVTELYNSGTPIEIPTALVSYCVQETLYDNNAEASIGVDGVAVGTLNFDTDTP